MHINWVKKNGKELPHCPRCGELLYNFSGDRIGRLYCYRCGSELEKDEKLKKLATYQEDNNEID